MNHETSRKHESDKSPGGTPLLYFLSLPSGSKVKNCIGAHRKNEVLEKLARNSQKILEYRIRLKDFGSLVYVRELKSQEFHRRLSKNLGFGNVI